MIQSMTKTLRTPSNALLPLAALAVLLALPSEVRAQEEAPSPSPSPAATASPSPAPAPAQAAPAVVEDDPIGDLDPARIEAEVERASARAQAEVAVAQRAVMKNQAAIEREARRAAASMAAVSGARVSAGAGRSAREAMGVAVGEREAAMREAMMEAQEAAQEAQEKARQDAQEAREKAQEKAREAREKAREKAEQQRDKEREKREEAREKAREERDRAREKADSYEELYDQAMEAIDEEDWSDALPPLNKLMSMNVQMDAALYWMSYAQGKMDRTAAALASLARLQKEYPNSRWAKEGKALELEVRGRSGQVPRPDQEDDLDLKLMAVSALAQTDPQEAMPVLSRILASPSSPRRVRERALFVLAQIGSEPAGNAIAEVAKGNSSPELQRKAIQYLGVFGGAGNRKVLSDIYATNTDNAIRKQILNAFMVSGDKARVLNAARTEKDPGLRADAVKLLGVMGGTTELSQMYTTATTTEEKKAIIQALFIGGAMAPIAAAAKGEKDKEVRLTAVRNLGLMGRKSEDMLGEMYRNETDPEVKKEVLNAFFLQNNATRLVDVARTEKDPGLKKEAVHWLSLMNSREARAYMLELLKD